MMLRPRGIGFPFFGFDGSTALAPTPAPVELVQTTKKPSQLSLFTPKEPNRWLAAVSPQTAIVLAGMSIVALIYGVYGWILYERFGVTGFDTGIFAHGTWLLSQLKNPFNTIRGLSIFGEHSSYILAFVAPLYALFPDPRTLILLQAASLVVPAYPIYRIASDRLGATVATVFGLTYLVLPVVSGTASWLFHPDCFAAAFLSLALLAAHRDQNRRLALWIALALLCKEDVSLLVFMFGLLMVVNGRRRTGIKMAVASIVYFATATFWLMPMTNGRGNIFFQRNYGIEVDGLGGLLHAIPTILSAAGSRATTNEGILFIALMFAPTLFMAFLAPKWLLPTVPALILNLASNIHYQYEITFWYSLTSASFIFVAAIYGYEKIRGSLTSAIPPMVAMVVAAVALTIGQAPTDNMIKYIRQDSPPINAIQRQALSMIPAGAPVASSYNFDAHLLTRTQSYEFPNPFQAVNWGFNDGTPHPQKDIDSVRWIVVDKSTLGPKDIVLLNQLQRNSKWTTRFSESGIIVLERP